jgi:hypothetical protein
MLSIYLAALMLAVASQAQNTQLGELLKLQTYNTHQLMSYLLSHADVQHVYAHLMESKQHGAVFRSTQKVIVMNIQLGRTSTRRRLRSRLRA